MPVALSTGKSKGNSKRGMTENKKNFKCRTQRGISNSKRGNRNAH
jgi:hypothetical protein